MRWSVGEHRNAVEAELESWRSGDKIRRLWSRDASLWTNGDEAQWLAWLDVVDAQIEALGRLRDFQADVKQAGFTDALLIGMGGSSLGPEVLAETFGAQPGFPTLHVLDSTDPAQIRSTERKLDLTRTLCIVASKSGSTLEPNILKQYFFDRIVQAVGADKAGTRFVAVTDPGSKMQQVAERDGFRAIFFGDPQIGGRYSILSHFGTVPATAIGMDVGRFLEDTRAMARVCAAAPPDRNPGVLLGCVMGVMGRAGHDKLTIVASPGIAGFGAWLEQLIAESTGKSGMGVIPIDGEQLAAPANYGDDRLFVYLRLHNGADAAQDDAVDALEQAGRPVIRIDLADRSLLGQEFFRWEFATAVAGSILGINPFDQPDVEASKNAARAMTEAFEKTGTLPTMPPVFETGGIALHTDAPNAESLRTLGAGSSLQSWFRAHFARRAAGDYVALLAYLDATEARLQALQTMRANIRDRTRLATCLQFGPRFLHSTGQAHKGGPNSGLFLQLTADPAADATIPCRVASFGVIEAAQAAGDFRVLSERGRRVLRAHIAGSTDAGIAIIAEAIGRALG